MRVLFSGDGFHHALDRQILIVAALEVAALVLEGYSGKAVAPSVDFGEGQVPEFFRRRISLLDAFLALLHVNGVETSTIGGIREASADLVGIALRLGHAFGQRFVPGLGFDHGKLVIAIDEHVVGAQRLGAPTMPFHSSERDGVLAQNPAAFDHAPARRLERGINVLGSGFGFVHSVSKVGR